MFGSDSRLKIFSLAIVAEDYSNTGDILAMPIEHLIVADNKKLIDLKENVKTEVKDLSGKSEKNEATVSGYITAKWLNFGLSNRASAPNVYKGETVVLFRYEEEDVYYWTTLFNEPRLRKLEEAVYTFSDVNPNKPELEATMDNSYSFFVSTKQKIIGLITSKIDGEAVKYMMTFDMKDNKFEISDDWKNIISIDSLKNLITLSANGDHITINGQAGVIDISAKTLINISAPTVICKGKKC